MYVGLEMLILAICITYVCSFTYVDLCVHHVYVSLEMLLLALCITSCICGFREVAAVILGSDTWRIALMNDTRLDKASPRNTPLRQMIRKMPSNIYCHVDP